MSSTMSIVFQCSYVQQDNEFTVNRHTYYTAIIYNVIKYNIGMLNEHSFVKAMIDYQNK